MPFSKVRITVEAMPCRGSRPVPASSAAELAEAVALTRPAASQHLKVLRDAGLVHVRVDGNQRLYRVDPARLEEVRRQLEGFWGDRLGRLAAGLEGGEER
jgi:DNA-binding transcriptional ArsR family regulator